MSNVCKTLELKALIQPACLAGIISWFGFVATIFNSMKMVTTKGWHDMSKEYLLKSLQSCKIVLPPILSNGCSNGILGNFSYSKAHKQEHWKMRSNF